MQAHRKGEAATAKPIDYETKPRRSLISATGRRIGMEQSQTMHSVVSAGPRTAEGLAPWRNKSAYASCWPKPRALETDASRLNGRCHGAWGSSAFFVPWRVERIAIREGHSVVLLAGSDAYEEQGEKFVKRALAVLRDPCDCQQHRRGPRWEWRAGNGRQRSRVAVNGVGPNVVGLGIRCVQEIASRRRRCDSRC
jgi:hypothetical protein